jgi:SAM-dependent methyltransferase
LVDVRLIACRALTRLLHRPRARALIERGARRALSAAGAEQEPHQPPTELPPPPEPEAIDPAQFARELRPGNLAIEQTPVTNAFFERLSAEDVAEVEQGVEQSPEFNALYVNSTSQRIKRHFLLSFGVHLGLPSVLEKTGLSDAQPPEDIHAMSRGPLAAGGGLYEADLVVDALASVGVDIASVDDALDFGCSSARVVRVLSTLYPRIRWHGCDPNGPAISWASESLPEVDLFASDDAPPLPRAAGSLDLVYAISIWSHFAPELGLRWFEEMHRLLRPGGHLVCTTHGLTSIAYYATRELRPAEQSQEILGSLYRQGCWYAPEFGEEGDWGVVNPDWGTAFLSPEWVLTQLCPRWRVLEFAPGRNQENQDVYVLQRV